MTFFRKLAAAAALSTTVAGAASAQTIVDIAAGDERFTTLVAAVKAAGLVDTLSGPPVWLKRCKAPAPLPFTRLSTMPLPHCPTARLKPC